MPPKSRPTRGKKQSQPPSRSAKASPATNVVHDPQTPGRSSPLFDDKPLYPNKKRHVTYDKSRKIVATPANARLQDILQSDDILSPRYASDDYTSQTYREDGVLVDGEADTPRIKRRHPSELKDSQSDMSDSDVETAETLEEESAERIDTATANRKSLRFPLEPDIKYTAESLALKPRVDYAEALKYGLKHLLMDAFAEVEFDRYAIADEISEDDFRIRGFYFLAAMPKAVLKLIVCGNLSYALLTERNPALVKLYDPNSEWHLRGLDKFAPAIYVKHLVSKTGESPSPAQLRIVINDLRMYVSGNPSTYTMALKIDNTPRQRSSKEDIEAGRHWYLQGSVNRIAKVFTFCKALEMRFEDMTEEELQQPMVKPLTYVGYSKTPARRELDHKRGDTSWLLNLVLAVCRYRFGVKAFDMDSFTVGYLAAEDEAAVAEVLISIITDSTVETGGGFCVYQGGVQVSSVKLAGVSREEQEALWESCLRFCEDHTEFHENVEAERKMLAQLEANPRPPRPDTPNAMEERLRAVELREDKIRKGFKEFSTGFNPILDSMAALAEEDNEEDIMEYVEKERKTISDIALGLKECGLGPKE